MKVDRAGVVQASFPARVSHRDSRAAPKRHRPTEVAAVVLSKKRKGSRTILTLREGKDIYRAELRGSGKHVYAVIRSQHGAVSPLSAAFTGIAVAIGRALANAGHAVMSGLARTGGGGVGRFIASSAFPMSLLLLALALLALGLASRRVAYARR